MSSARFTRRCFLAGATLGTAVKAGDPQPIGELVGGMAELVKLQRLPRVASNVAPSEFPQTDDVWQADFFHSPTFISHDDVGVECVMVDELPELHDFCHLRQDVDEQPRCPSWCPGCPASKGQDLSLQSPVCHDEERPCAGANATADAPSGR